MSITRQINDIHQHIASLMKVSAKYGKKMGTMGTLPWNSAAGATFARKTADMMSKNPNYMEPMLGSMLRKAQGAGMSEEHLKRFNTVFDRIRSRMQGPRNDLTSLNYL